MPKAFSKVNLGLQGDADWRALPVDAQHLYLMLWTSPALTYCGSHEWRPGRFVSLASDWSVERITAAADCLWARHFIVIDETTEEVLIRSWFRFDETLKSPNLVVAFVKAYRAMWSTALRDVLAYELTKVRDRHPSWPCWKHPALGEILAAGGTSAKALETAEDPFANPSQNPAGNPSRNPSQDPSPGGSPDPSSMGEAAPSRNPSRTNLQPSTFNTQPTDSQPANDSTDAAKTDGTSHAKVSASADAEREFAEFWQTWPRKKAKGDAAKAFKAARKKVDLATLVAAVEAQRRELTKDGLDFCPYAASWLRAERWTDEPDLAAAPAKSYGPPPIPPPGLTDAEMHQWVLDNGTGGDR